MTAALESVGQSAVVQEQTAERGVQEQERGVVLFGATAGALQSGLLQVLPFGVGQHST